jgi:hypothetical protein
MSLLLHVSLLLLRMDYVGQSLSRPGMHAQPNLSFWDTVRIIASSQRVHLRASRDLRSVVDLAPCEPCLCAGHRLLLLRARGDADAGDP